MSFEWDYGYDFPLRGLRDPKGRLSGDLRSALRQWMDIFEAGNPSDPDDLGDSWFDQGRYLCERVQRELGANYEVVFWPDRRPCGQ